MNRPAPDLTLLRAAVVFFPLVGGLIGLFTGSVVWAALFVWPPVVAVGLGLIAEALLTGGIHEEAVADCCDAFGGGWTRDDVLRIMKDSRVGSFGALGLGLAVLLRGGCLLVLPVGELVPASAAVGRWAVLVLMLALPHVPNREGLSKDVGERIGARELLIGSLFMLIALSAFAWAEPLAVVPSVFAVVAVTLARGVVRPPADRRGDGRRAGHRLLPGAVRDATCGHRGRAMTRRLLLMRHPPVDLSYRGVCDGASDVPLAADGLAMLPALVEAILADGRPDAISSSGLIRCRVLAEAVGERCGVAVVIDPRLRERNFGGAGGTSVGRHPRRHR
jgi:adenosylcobinamide-GDP ribazoletransferase